MTQKEKNFFFDEMDTILKNCIAFLLYTFFTRSMTHEKKMIPVMILAKVLVVSYPVSGLFAAYIPPVNPPFQEVTLTDGEVKTWESAIYIRGRFS